MAKPQQDEPVRIPLGGNLISRTISQGTTSGPASGVIGFGVIGTMVIGSSAIQTKDQRFVNAFAEKVTNPLTGQSTLYITKRPGFTAFNTPSAGNVGTALHVWAGSSNEVISAFGGTNSTIFSGTSSLGALTGLATRISDTLVGTTPNLAIVTDANKGYFFPLAGAMTNIADADFPGNAGETVTGGFAHMNGFNYIMTTSGKIYNSDLNSLSSWTAASFLSANMEPDGGIGVLRYKNTILAFGKESIEFYQDVGNATGSPLQRVDQGFIKLGVVNQYCMQSIDDTIVWVGTSSNSGVGLYMLDGFQPKRVSTPTIDSILSRENVNSLFLNAIHMFGKTFIVIVATSSVKTYVYCVEDDTWHEWSSGVLLWQYMHGVGTGTRFIYAVTKQDTSGKVYFIDPTSLVFTDNSANYTVSIQTSRWDNGNSRRKFLNRIRVVGDIQSSSTPIDILWSDDDYGTYSNPRTVNMTSTDPTITGCGSFKRRAFLLTNTSATPLRLEALELEFSQGGMSA